ncbi:inositol 1,4,5-trisphosphate receptor-interacting protein [Spea bombifrons]|uniref:inositol 1,4,5-trisphosphate receptor-interacting protein n=1 Tax=Spea bombifrons TaxID=233779 RepID=UPI002348FF5B|nr:inositol 1,4,5-trisphosphate receptor-interacting protein [Spea bombifrons]XP_053306266.1 inositol 1,4,5-trisphosphate receptor-interacting protein [Spea bombifrons]
MASGIFKVCMIVVTAIVNHPLLFPRNNATLPTTDEALIQKLREYEENHKTQQEQLEKLLSDQETPQEALAFWDIWSAMSMFLLLLIEVLRQDFMNRNSQDPGKEEDTFLSGNMLKGVSIPEKTILAAFYDQCIKVTTHEAARTREFVEGFVDDLLEALRSLCNRDADMEVEDSVCVGSTYENWRVNKPLECDLIVPFAPPEPFQFECRPWVIDQSITPHKQGYGTIRVCRPDDKEAGCVCGKTKLGEDLLCLVHSQNIKKNDNEDMNLLCSKNSNYLAKDQVMMWFQTSLTKAWSKISHKYEFDLNFRNLNIPGALRVKFRSGKVISFNITPVVQYEDSDLYLVSHFPSAPEPQDNIYWDISFAVYEKRFLKEVAKHLPDNSCHLSCLQIMTFLYSKQCSISGQTGLTTYHLKTVLLHLLLVRPSSEWDRSHLDSRLKDMLRSLEKCLLEKKLNHFMVGNPDLPESVKLPEVFRLAEPFNLFRPFVLNRDLYQNTLATFYEMLKNVNVLVNEYTLHTSLE